MAVETHSTAGLFADRRGPTWLVTLGLALLLVMPHSTAHARDAEFAERDGVQPDSVAQNVAAPEPEPTSEPVPEPEPEPVPEPDPEPEVTPFVPLTFGDRSNRVRKLQSRLHQLGHHSEIITWRYDVETRRAVAAFKKKHQLPGRPGVVGKPAWEALLSMTREPTKNALNNVYTPGKPLWKLGAKGPAVRRIEARLAQKKHFSVKVGPRYDRKTRQAVRAFQRAERIPVTGQVDARTRNRLWNATRKPTRGELRNWQFHLDPRCLQGRALCIDKTTRTLKWVVDGQVRTQLAARFGGPSTPTREGTFHVYWKSRDHVSSIYGTAMPFALFFSGGQAVHYSDNFRRTGYSGASGGCVNIRNRTAMRTLFDRVRVGEKVVVHRS